MKKNTLIFDNDNLNLLILSIPAIALIIFSFIVSTPKEIADGLYRIIAYPDMLLTDYLAVGGVGATFFNVGLVTLISIYIIYICDMPVTGHVIASVLTVAGFSFIGKNIVNIWPIFIGTLLYARYKNIELKNISVASLFATTLAPAVSEIALGLKLNYIISIPLAILVGIGIGFVIVPLATHMAKFHDGYSLYNVGFTGGILGTLIASLLRGFGLIIEPQSYLSYEYNSLIKNLLIIIFLLYIIIGFILNNKSFKGYSDVLKPSGRNLSDFLERFGIGLAYINVGVLGLISIIYVILVGGVFNGPVAAGIITVAAFAPCGKNPKNSIPILLGVYIAACLKVFDVSSTSIIMAALFGTTLAPIAGAYGRFAGMFAGFLHVSIVSNIVMVHGGLNLYNNGFSGGIVAAIILPILQTFFKKQEIVE